MKNILVTGGAGFLGSHLCDHLISAGHNVICIDNLQTGSLNNIVHLFPHPHFKFVPLDIELPLNSVANVDEIYNMACPASPVHYQTDPVRTMRTCVIGALHVLELARRSGARVLQASTSEVYGDPEIHPQDETYRGCVQSFGPRACYDEGKRAAEALFHDYHRMYGVDVRLARIFNTYGSRMAVDDGRVVSNFIMQALMDRPLTVYGDGSQTRSFCHVSDLVDGLVRLMASDGTMCRPCNLGNPEEFTITELAALVLKLTGSRSTFAHEPLPADDPTRRRPDIAMARRVLDWQPKVPLAEGLQQTVDYFRCLAATQQGVAGNIATVFEALTQPAGLMPWRINGTMHIRPLHEITPRSGSFAE
ncbi:UDP-glucuronic acid decarboxylase family protein [Roseovarius sp. S4756]|uniref:UDP-glucuronic acid decarboxylase family protein n=1 Tax=Roseovarius maritimus TaxID=3342637 RepID=UPI0037289E0B